MRASVLSVASLVTSTQQDPIAIDGSREDGVAGTLVHRHRLAGHWRLVHGRVALGDLAVGRQPLAGLDDDNVAAQQFLNRDFDLRAVAAHQRRLRRQIGQRFDRPARPVHRRMFQGVAETEQEEQQRAFGPVPQRRGPRRRDQHEGVDIEAFRPQALHRIAHGEEAAECIGGKIESKRYRMRRTRQPAEPAAQQQHARGETEYQLAMLRPPSGMGFQLQDSVAQRLDAAHHRPVRRLLAVVFQAQALGGVAHLGFKHAIEATQCVFDNGGAGRAVHPFDA